VERVLNMADGVILLVDAFEGPMPQTRFVLGKAIELGLKPVVVVNKVDKPNCTPDEVHEAVFDLMFALDATEDQLNFPTVYGSSKNGWMGPDWKTPTEDVSYLLDVILEHVPAPKQVPGTLQMRITSLDYSTFQGRIAVGRVSRGTIKAGQQISLVKNEGGTTKGQIKELMIFEGLGKEKIKTEVGCGEIVALMGLENFDIGDTVADAENPEGLAKFKVDEPTMSMLFTINNSPFFGKEGQFVTSRHVRDRLFKEIEKNLAMRLQETESPDRLLVFGRGILHLSILVETMRREGYEFQLGQPQVLYKEIEGQRHEPMELLTVQVPEQFSSRVIDNVTRRKGDILNIEQKSDRTVLEFSIPARGIIGLRNALLTATEGEAIIAHRFKGYEPYKGTIQTPRPGCIVSGENGAVVAYALDKLQDRGKFFVDPGEEIYIGQVIGESPKPGEELVVNVVRTKKLTNMRASGTDEKLNIAPAVKFSLEECMEYIADDEYLEVTPKSLRMRKIHLSEVDRKRNAKKLQDA
ncbi:MAG TPA: GTP-binding protein, partial [Flavobacteriales bacterium]|nr:GTP-binding protein [Flavobacteriales bacterium]